MFLGAMMSEMDKNVVRRRATATCPNCGERCLIQGSKVISRLTREFRLQCQNMDCGWTGVATMEIVHTISPPNKHLVKNTLPPDVGKEYFETKK